MNRARTGASSKTLLPVERRHSTKVSQKNVKLCELCGTLNLESNKECWTCRWYGSFSRDEQVISLAWQRLETLFEEVRAEHVTARRSLSVGDFGAARPVSLRHRIFSNIAAWWQRFQDQRDLRMAQREARLHSRMPTPPDQLGV
ncbi:MAG: hypothetical protein ACRYFS_24975 [Janthinobacterium lividum]